MRLMLVTALLFNIAYADSGALPFESEAGCQQGALRQFGQYIGDWQIADSRRIPDTGEWASGDGARWIFSCLGDGTAIQDFWMPNVGTIGTNLRTYHEETESWDIAWAVKGTPGFAHITAKENKLGEIVMHYRTPLPDPLRRITFYPASDDGWKWKLEISPDGDSWTEVYRITATPFVSG